MNPFSEDPSKTVGAVGELGLLKRINTWLGDANPQAPHGMGDDCAVVPVRDNLLTNDSLVYGRHYDDSADPEAVGAKLLKRNLSDIAAMGGDPGGAVVALFLPRRTSLEWLEGFTHGLRDCALQYGARIVGGDLTESEGFLGGTLTLTGHAARPLLRTGAGAGDYLCVSGPLGGSIEGHHLDFEPRLREGRFLGERSEVHSCIDLTDGIAKDLTHLLSPQIAASLDVESLPPSDCAVRRAGGNKGGLVESMLSDGEDYELLFSIDGDCDLPSLRAAWEKEIGRPLFVIGRVVAREPGTPAIIDAATGESIECRFGYEHFGKA